MPALAPYQKDFIQFLVRAGALTFGDFVTKSGRKTPYFVNTGRFNSSRKIAELGNFYASHIVALKLGTIASIFGPAYKGIPLCVTTAIALAREHGLDIGYTFDRKEVKDHGDGGKLVGHPLAKGERVVIVEDVITAGTTLSEIVPFLRQSYDVEIAAVVIAVDRCERGTGTHSAVQETKEKLDVMVHPIVTVHDIIAVLEAGLSKEIAPKEDLTSRMREYLQQYGAQ